VIQPTVAAAAAGTLIQPTAVSQPAAAATSLLSPPAAAAGGPSPVSSPLKANVVVGIQPLGQNTVSYKVPVPLLLFVACPVKNLISSGLPVQLLYYQSSFINKL
jgi:hypothetical protein